MPKYRVYAIRTASQYLGEIEAASAEEAEEKGYETADIVSLCHSCAKQVELGDDIDKIEVQEADAEEADA